jgi:arginyl-tRNA synthetase
MAGRLGRGVKSDDLLNILERNALEEVQKRDRGYDEAEAREIAHTIAVGAVRYFLLKFTRNSVIAFDFKEALSFQGESGPYVQYTIVRINSIYRKLEEAGIVSDEMIAPDIEADLFARDENADFWPLVYLAAQYPDVLERAAEMLEPALIAKYAFQLAQSMNEFNHSHRIKDEPDADRRALLIAIIGAVRATLVAALDILGIDAPRRM